MPRTSKYTKVSPYDAGCGTNSLRLPMQWRSAAIRLELAWLEVNGLPQRARKALIDDALEKMQGLDAFIYPTVPVIAPTLAELADDAEYGRLNLLALRNPSIANFLDMCATSIPIRAHGTAPVRLNVHGRHDGDEALLALAAGIERSLAPQA